MQMTECAAIKAQCSIWMELGRENDWTKDYFIPKDKKEGDLYKYDDAIIDRKSIYMHLTDCGDVDPREDNKDYTEVPAFHIAEGQSIGGFSGMCKTKQKRVCHLKKCRMFRNKIYCIRKCRTESVETCF